VKNDKFRQEPLVEKVVADAAVENVEGGQVLNYNGSSQFISGI